MKHCIFSPRTGGLGALVFTILALTPPAPAAVTNVAWYRLGENDPGAASGQVVNTTTINFVGGKDLRRFVGRRYANAVQQAAADQLHSSQSL